ncbi:MAG: hypothetical protein ABSF58_07775 [Solirubrobacteraceae bacterium]
MQRTHSGRPALIRRLAATAVLTGLLVATLATALLTSRASAGSAVAAVTVRVEGTKATLVPATRVVLPAAKVTKNGIAADSCAGASAAGALELATHGDWTGTWSASYKSYFLTGIEGLSFPSTGAQYWAFWVNDAPSAAGICSRGDRATVHGRRNRLQRRQGHAVQGCGCDRQRRRRLGQDHGRRDRDADVHPRRRADAQGE